MRMKRVILKAFLALLVTFTACHAVGEEAENRCDSPFRIYFGNGIMNLPDDWIDSRLELEATIGSKYRGMPVSYGNSFNPSGGFLNDLTTVFQQKLSEDSSLSWEILVKVFLGLTTDLNPVVVSYVNALIQSVADQSTEELKKKFESEYAYVDQKVLQDVGAYTDDILNHSRRVLVVGHSQGNLYSNAAYKLLYTNPMIKTQSFRIVGVASPANFVAGGGLYVTSDKDMVINALRFLVASSTLPANTPVDFNESDISGHNFIATYMNPAFYARSRVVSMIRSQLSEIEEPPSSYDYKVRMDFFKIDSVPTIQGYMGPIYLPTYLCDSFSEPLGCARASLRYLSDRNGAAYDPEMSPEFSSVASAVIKRLSARAPEVADPNSAVNMFITAQFPALMVSYVGPQNGQFYYYTDHYDAAGVLNPVPLLHFNEEFSRQMGGIAAILNYIYYGTPATFYTSLPKTNQVISDSFEKPLANLALRLKGKVSYEVGESEISAIPNGSLSTMTYRMRVCREEPV